MGGEYGGAWRRLGYLFRKLVAPKFLVYTNNTPDSSCAGSMMIGPLIRLVSYFDSDFGLYGLLRGLFFFGQFHSKFRNKVLKFQTSTN